MNPIPKFQEEYSAKLPALALLTNLGWSFLPPEQALAARGGKPDEVDLCRILSADLQQGPFAFADRSNAFLEKDRRVLMRQLSKGKRLVNGEEIA